jgi:hypothetical protein
VAVVVPDEGGEARTGGFRGGGAQPAFPWCCCSELVSSRQRTRGRWTLRTGVTVYTGVPRPASDLAAGLATPAGVPGPALPLPLEGRPTSKLTARLVAPTGLPRRRRRFRLQDAPPVLPLPPAGCPARRQSPRPDSSRLQDAPPGVVASACRALGVGARGPNSSRLQ